LLFTQAALLYQIGELRNVFWQKYRVVQQLLVTLVTENSGFSFMIPWA
jgi:hypothetical protein